ncbi:STAS domain-containing protein [Thalassobacillus devorans]|uniref:STAS domain-containing protein n=1 Tax=Thalassobacillus devorans TaxID=279813 RepID=UPI00048C4381|nr:STAS domain-containing protein [Thalassobacillus devorans]
MKLVENIFSVPYLIINRQYEVLYFSKEVEEITDLSSNFLELVDEGSISKVQEEVSPAKNKNKVEINIYQGERKLDPLLIDLYIHWKNDLQAELLLIPKDQRISDITVSLGELRSRLSNTNFELLEEKEKLQEAIDENNRLSAPFIELSSTTALVPLFGDLNDEKMYTISDNLLEAAQQADKETILVDLTAVGDIHHDGIVVFQNIVQSLSYMGIEIVVIGVNPDHAQKINQLQLKLGLRFISSLHKAIQKYCQ